MTTLNSVSDSRHIQALYRFLLIRTGQRGHAENALRETLTTALSAGRRDQNQIDYAEYYRAALKMPAGTPELLATDLVGWPLALHQLPEPERSAITLFYLEIFSPSILSGILGVNLEELAALIETARKFLENGQTKTSIP